MGFWWYKPIKKINAMYKAIQRSSEDYMGFTWFEIFKNGKTTGNSYNALDEEHAIAIHKQFKTKSNR
jgi:hypothetical protein